jgi:hypothetical protein
MPAQGNARGECISPRRGSDIPAQGNALGEMENMMNRALKGPNIVFDPIG